MKTIKIFIGIMLLIIGSYFIFFRILNIKLPQKKFKIECHLKTDQYQSISEDFNNFLLYDKEVINITKYKKAKVIRDYYQEFPYDIDKLTEDRKVKLKTIIADVDAYENQVYSKYNYEQYLKGIELYEIYSPSEQIAFMNDSEKDLLYRIKNYLIKHENSFLNDLKQNLEINSEDYQIEETLIDHFSSYPWLLDELSLIDQMKLKYIKNSISHVRIDSIKSETKYTKTLELNNFIDSNKNSVFKGELNGVNITIPFSKISEIKRIRNSFEIVFKNKNKNSIIIDSDFQSFHGYSNNIKYSFSDYDLLWINFLN